MKRRRAIQALAASCLGGVAAADKSKVFEIDYVLASALYGDLPLDVVVPELARAGALGLDLWGKPHGTQREELERMGIGAFAELLRRHGAKLHVSTRYPLGPFRLQEEMPVLEELGGKILVCGATGPKDPVGAAAKEAVRRFLEKMGPHADAAATHGLVIAIENHAGQLLSHPDSIRYFAELNHHRALGVAFAPHHLHKHVEEIPELIAVLGAKNLPFIYFQEHGIGSTQKVAKEVELEQLPGRGKLDYVPILQALREIRFTGVAEIFMHPTPRGVPMLETAGAITDTILESRLHIDQCLAKTH